MSKAKKKHRSPSNLRGAERYFRRKANLLASAIDEVKRNERADEWKRKKGKHNE